MAYSDSVVTLERMLPYLMPLSRGEEVTWRTGAGQARKFAYRLREALHLANKYGYPQIAGEYRVEVLGASAVRAVQKIPLFAEPTVGEPATIPPLVHMDTRQVLTEDWLAQVQEAWAQRGLGSSRVYLPRAWPSREQLLSLHEWTQDEGLIFFENDGALTLLPLAGNEDTAPFAWSPEDDE